MMGHDSIAAYHAAQSDGDRAICDALHDQITRGLPEAEARMWHAHPVWFLSRNPIVSYSKLKSCVRLLFWSGQGFETPGLSKSGTFKAAEARFTHVDDIDRTRLQDWLRESREVQWDYANIVKKKGRLDRLS